MDSMRRFIPALLLACAPAYAASARSFEPHRRPDAFLSRGPGYVVLLEGNAVTLVRGRTTAQLKFAGVRPGAVAEGLDPLPGRANYLLGDDRSQWRTGVAQFARVRFRGLYPGIDVVYYWRGQDFEYDLFLAPGADPARIRMAIHGPLRLAPPKVYQDGRIVPASYARRGPYVTFRLGPYDRRRPLVIDPVLSLSTFLGGAAEDAGNAVALDAQGNIYITGYTRSANFVVQGPLPGGAANAGPDDVFVTKLNPAGTQVIYSTYLGGAGNDRGLAIAVDGAGAAYVAGSTVSNNFPMVGAVQGTNRGNGDGFVAKLNPAGNALVYSTYLGGSQVDQANAIAVDAAGAVYLTGFTFSADFPMVQAMQMHAGLRDAFIAKLNPAGSALVYSSCLGSAGDEVGNGIAVDAGGSPYLTGWTSSAAFPVTPGVRQGALSGAQDAFVTKYAASGAALVYSTLLGGAGSEQGAAVAVDSGGNAYVTGFTDSADFPTTAAAFQAARGGERDAFVIKLNPTATALVYSTYLGSAGTDQGLAIAVDSGGAALVAGFTDSPAFPSVGAFQSVYAGGTADGFVTKLNAAGSALGYSTFLGGAEFDQVSAVAVDATGNAVVAGTTASPAFTTTAGALQRTYGGDIGDAFVAKIIEPQPTLPAGGVVNGASFAPGAAVAPGSIASLFGTNLASATAFAGAVPLPLQLGGALLRFNTTQSVPMFYSSLGQLNFQVPWELAGQSQATLTDQVGTPVSNPLTVRLAQYAPGLFSVNSSGAGLGAIQIANTSFFAQAANAIPGAQSRPANRGTDSVTIYATGLGPVTNRPASGAAAPSAPLAATTTTPVVSIGGVNATVSFSGLAPGFVGLYQINALVPAAAPTGDTVQVRVTIGSVPSNVVTIAVR
jgi:uncharacterized protein (TIGR03437 family)